jgi:hypothetical protein
MDHIKLAIAQRSMLHITYYVCWNTNGGQNPLSSVLNQVHSDQSQDDSPPSVSALLDVLPLPDEEPFEDTGSIPAKDDTRLLIIYTYSESPNARENLKFFLAKGVHGAADFFFVFNGATNATELIPSEPNIKVIKRENKCFDLGTVGEVLMKDNLWKGYKRFITLNASIRGPFFPTYASKSCWSDVFLDRITEKVKV